MDVESVIKLLIAATDKWGSEIIGGGMAIICAIIGAKMATRSSKTLERGIALRDAYADVFAAYYKFLKDHSDEKALQIAIAMERAMLLCSAQSEELMKEITELLFREAENMEELGEEIQRLRVLAKKDVENYMGKKRCSKVKEKRA